MSKLVLRHNAVLSGTCIKEPALLDSGGFMSRLVKIALIVVAGLVGVYVVASLAVSSLTTARIKNNEAHAIGSVRAVLSAQASFAAMDCGGLYAPRLTALASHVGPRLAVADEVETVGHRITLRVSEAAPDRPDLPPACAGAAPSFVVTAAPVEPGQSGARYFRATEEGELVEATSSDFPDAKPVR
jgi:hypothetical protein